MDLNQMEANDLDGDTDDLWVTLQSMGFSDDLALDEVALYFRQLKKWFSIKHLTIVCFYNW